MSIGSRTKELRENNKWSQSRLAREVKTNVTSVQKWENAGFTVERHGCFEVLHTD